MAQQPINSVTGQSRDKQEGAATLAQAIVKTQPRAVPPPHDRRGRLRRRPRLSGDHIRKETPVPIPNTVVKLSEPMIVPTSAKVGIASFFKPSRDSSREGFFVAPVEYCKRSIPLRLVIESNSITRNRMNPTDDHHGCHSHAQQEMSVGRGRDRFLSPFLERFRG